MKKLLALIALAFAANAWGATPLPIYCISGTLTPCSSTTQIGNGSQGDIWWKAFGKVDDMGYQLGLFSSMPANEVEATPNGASGIPGLRSLVGADIPPINLALIGSNGGVTGILPLAEGGTGTATPGLVAGTNITLSGTWPNQTINSSGGSGSGTVNSGTSGQVGCYATTGTAISGCATTGSGSTVPLSVSPTLTTPILSGYATASLPTCNSSSKGSLAYTTDGTPAFTFCNGSTWTSTGGTTFTVAGTGCTPTAVTGDATGGSFTLAAGPCTAVTVTFNGAVGMTAPHMWVCAVSDQTLQNAGTWFGTWGQSASTTTTATIPIPPAAGATDVVTFNCSPH